MSTSARVIVGIDGTPHSDAAVWWATAFAQESGCGLHLVHAYLVPAVPSVAGPLRTPEQRVYALAHAEKLLRRARRVVSAAAPSGLQVTTEAVHGRAVDVLCGQSAESKVVVLGRHSGWSRLHRLGAVVDGCLKHAACPVVVVPERVAVSDLPVPTAAELPAPVG